MLAGRSAGVTLMLWLTPVLVALLVARMSESRLTDLIGAGVAIMLLVWAVRRPGTALSILAVVAAVQSAAFGFLYALHVPASVLRAGGGLKDLLGISVLLAAIGHMRKVHRRPDGLDILGLAYLGLATLYLLVPHIFGSDTPLQWSDRLLAWRLDAGYVLLFLAVRHAPISPEARRRFVRVVLGIGAVVTGFALYQYVSPHGFEHLIVNTGKQAAYQQNVLHNSPATIESSLQYVTNLSGRVRVGSILISPFDMADYLLLVAAVLAETIVRGARHWTRFALLGGLAFAIFVSQVRADALAVLIIFGICLIPAPRRPTTARWRMLLVVAIGAALVIPSLHGTRFAGGGTASSSAQQHVREATSGLDQLGRQPLGMGLGYNPVIGNRFLQPGSGNYTSDNSVLQVGDELGVPAMAVWLAFVVAVLVALRRRARAPDAIAAIAGLALLGILVTGLFHHVFLNYSTSWTIWPMAGLGLGALDPSRRPAGPQRTEPVPVGTAALQ